MQNLSLKLSDNIVMNIENMPKKYKVEFENIPQIYNDLFINKSNFVYYMDLFQKAKNRIEIYNVYLLAYENLKVDDRLLIGENDIGVITSPNNRYLGIYCDLYTNNILSIKDYLIGNTCEYEKEV